MREFSFSYRLCGVSSRAICERLLRAKVPAYVFDEARGWTTVVVSIEYVQLDLARAGRPRPASAWLPCFASITAPSV